MQAGARLCAAPRHQRRGAVCFSGTAATSHVPLLVVCFTLRSLNAPSFSALAPLPAPQLCEFIEDCEFTFLSVQILHLLGEEGPKTKDPGAPPAACPRACLLACVRACKLASFVSSQNTEARRCRPGLGVAVRVAASEGLWWWLPPCPLPPAAARYIRYIYNRVILENATVGASYHAASPGSCCCLAGHGNGGDGRPSHPQRFLN